MSSLQEYDIEVTDTETEVAETLSQFNTSHEQTYINNTETNTNTEADSGIYPDRKVRRRLQFTEERLLEIENRRLQDLRGRLENQANEIR